MRRFMCLVLSVAALAAVTAGLAAPAGADARAGLAATPPMGWNDWYAFFCDIDEELITQTADAMVRSGMRDAGYRYVNLDDCWMARSRDADGTLQADPERFPHGIKWLADYVHARGLELGIYQDVGTKTCAGFPGSYGHFEQDARTFARWEVDFVKVDWCNVPFGDFPGMSQQEVARKLYGEYGAAIRDSGRPMLYSICEWDPRLEPWTWAPAISHMWRTNFDYANSWSAVLRNLDGQAGLSRYAGPGRWNDPDILQVGLPGGLGDLEDEAHFSLWAILAAPLLAGNDVRSMSPRTRATLTNDEVIAVDQDPLGVQGERVRRDGDADIWARPLANGDRAVVLLNRGDTPRSIGTSAGELGLAGAPAYAVRDLWRHATAQSAGRITATVPARSAAMLRVSTRRAVDPAIAPATAVDPPAGPRLPGLDGSILQPGEPATVSATFRNDGPTGLEDLRLALDAPVDWRVRPLQTAADSVGRNGTFTGRWEVTPPADASGEHRLGVSASYAWGSRRGSVEAAGSVSVRRLTAPTGSVHLSDVDWIAARSDFSFVHRDRNYYGGPLSIHGVTYAKGLWANANATIDYYVGGNCSRLTADLGLDDSDRGPGSVVYRVYADGRLVYDSGVVRNATPTLRLDQDVRGAQVLRIAIGDAGDGIDYDNADVAGGRLECATDGFEGP